MNSYHCSQLFCRYCKLSGHLITACPTRPLRPDLLNSSLVSLSNIAFLLQRLLSISGNTPVAFSTPLSNSKWYFDSSCFNHMSPLRNIFSSMSTTTNGPSVNIANGSLLHATHKGSISQSTLNFPDTYYISKLNFNLISVGQLVDLSFEVTFFVSGCRVQDPQTRQIIGSGRKVGRLFELENLHIPPVLNFRAASSPSTLHLWHQRLTHTSLGKLCPLVSQGVLSQVIKVFRRDNAMEYRDSKLLTFLAEQDTLSEFSYPDSLLLFLPHDYSKLEPRAHMCCFLGYGTEHKGYRCWDPLSKRIRISRHVVFWEYHMLSQFSSFESIPTTQSPLFTNPNVDLFPSDDSTDSISSDPLQPPVLSPSPSPDDSRPDNDFASTVMPPLPARSSRVRNPPPHLLDYHFFSTILHQHEPKSFREASSNPNWQQAMQEEMQELEKAHTWDLVDPPSDQEVVGSRWVYKIKTRSDGSIDRYKARLVAQDCTQEYGIDYEETFASVTRLTSVRALLAIVAVKKWSLSQMDVKNAFLNGNLKKKSI
ncbi:uncharacterized protein LOC107466891 [Arachis duranensis]|uniref:Uncharacterized protein LOC107466891 n=1 Tax=Arachis duranensis TaxID=130453 RepID=A0A6P4C6Q0_ARADU|nr:uncharacterized protein LOC107466891 [Arachis duranensis]